VILRACNELLRRLSRAEDAQFCGRVFVFVFQSFPLGDRSSVNRHGDYNMENVTAFDHVSDAGTEEHQDQDVSMADVGPGSDASNQKSDPKDGPADTDMPETDSKIDAEPKSMDIDELYSTFWALQKSFAYPPRLFDAKLLDNFKLSFAATLMKLREIPKVMSATAPESRRVGKRTAEETERDEFTNSFNPKYLTSRELFELEVCDPESTL
jgi:THO complex subunit 1